MEFDTICNESLSFNYYIKGGRSQLFPMISGQQADAHFSNIRETPSKLDIGKETLFLIETYIYHVKQSVGRWGRGKEIIM